MSSWLNQAIDRAGQMDDWLSPKREASLALLRQQQWPTRKTEAWKYTPLHALTDAQFATDKTADNETAVEHIDNLNSIDLLFVNGKLINLPDNLPEGLEIISLAAADKQGQERILESFGTIKPQRHLFGLVNDVLTDNGILITTTADTNIEKPLRIVHRVSDDHEAHTRVMVQLGENSQLTVIEHFTADSGFNTGFAEFDLAHGASLEHYRFALQGKQNISIGGCHFRLGESSELVSTTVGFGSPLTRIDMDVEHAAPHANALINAIYLLNGSELFDLHSTIEHAAPHGTTEENVRGIVAGKSKAVFNGRIHIHRDAQKTLAELNNRNLMLSRDAEIDTKPELEIYADDVRCAHGATIAEVDKKALYYLQSRGIAERQAKIMLSFGFINELVEQMPNQALANWLRPQLRERFADMNQE